VGDTAERARMPGLEQARDFRYFVSQACIWAERYLVAAAFTTLTSLVRLLVLLLTLPLVLTSVSVGLVDGLVHRDVRKFGAGRESGFVYHRAKASLLPLAVLPWVVYLGDADLGASVADPITQRGITGLCDGIDRKQLQKVLIGVTRRRMLQLALGPLQSVESDERIVLKHSL